MAALDFIPENYRNIVYDAPENNLYYTEAHLEEMIAHYFDQADVEVVKEQIATLAVPDGIRLRMQMAVVVLSEGKLGALKGLISSAEIDYRDVLMELR